STVERCVCGRIAGVIDVRDDSSPGQQEDIGVDRVIRSGWTGQGVPPPGCAAVGSRVDGGFGCSCACKPALARPPELQVAAAPVVCPGCSFRPGQLDPCASTVRTSEEMGQQSWVWF